MTLALVGNQNSGKTTLFNQLTGSRQKVGNFPGVTVEQKSGRVRQAQGVTVVDLPGIYSLRSFSAEEMITRDFLIDGKPDGIINIVDATNIERNLYLTLQLMEMRIPMVLALNMMDEVRGNGGSVDIEKMSEDLGIPVIPITASRNEGVTELIRRAMETASRGILPGRTDFCGPGPVHRCIHSVMHAVEDHAQRQGLSPRFAAIKLVEGDRAILDRLALKKNEEELVEHSVLEMQDELGMDRNEALADMRYAFIQELTAQSVRKGEHSRERRRSVRMDAVLTHRVLGIPIFLAVMLLIFYLTFDVLGEGLSGLLGRGIDRVAEGTESLLTGYGINPVVQSLILDGVFAGLGSVLSFLPIIMVLFFFLSVLEDTGYMARVAFIMDKALRRVGLSGRSIVPMLIGFGCTVPAIMATRTLSSRRDRIMTILLAPFMSCSAKIPIYALFAAAFFQNRSGLVMLVLYGSGIILGLVTVFLLGRTLLKGGAMPFIMELPNYRFPSLKSTALLIWEKTKDFLLRAFTVIFVATLAVWFLRSFDGRLNPVAEGGDSLLAALGRLIAPLLAPLGFGDWRAATALVTGLTAKEAVVSTLGVLMEAAPGTGLTQALAGLFTSLSAASFLSFVLLYTPCIATLAATGRELRSRGMAAAILLFQLVLAWVVSLAVYRLGALFL